MHIKLTKIKMCMYTVGALKYDDVQKGKTTIAGPVTDTYLELKCYVYFILS